MTPQSLDIQLDSQNAEETCPPDPDTSGQETCGSSNPPTFHSRLASSDLTATITEPAQDTTASSASGHAWVNPSAAPSSPPSVEPQPPTIQNHWPLPTSPTTQVASAPPSPYGWLRRVLWGGLFAGTAIASAAIGATIALTLPLPNGLSFNSEGKAGLADLWQSGFRYQVSRPVNVLVMGIDEVPGVPETSEEIFAGRTDTLLLVHLDPESHKVSVISIPRDTRVDIPGYGMAKINHANLEGGPQLVAQTLANNLGDVPIDRYVRVSTGAFREIVDLVGGVEVMVPKRMVYEDHTQGLYIDLYPGWQTLNGDQAEQFARFRKDDMGDIGRVQRQQMLLKSLRERLTSPTIIPKLPQIIRVLQRYIDTNLSLEEMLALAHFALDLQTQDLQMVMLPGRFSAVSEYNASYWLADWEASDRILQDFFQAEPVVTLAAHDAQATTDLTIAVQNASGSAQVGRTVAQYLRNQGFYNVYVTEDWPAAQATTQVIAQQGDVRSAEVLQSVLGVGTAIADSTGDIQSHITIRVGEDWLEKSSLESPEAPLK